MTSHIEMACPRCARGLRIRSEYRGRSVICNHCDRGFEVARDADGEPGVPGGGRSADPHRRVVEADRLEVELRSARAEIERLRAELDGLRASTRESAEEAARELESVRTERGRLVDEMHSLRASRDLATIEVERLRGSHERCEALREGCNRAEAWGEELARALDLARDELREVRSAHQRDAERWRALRDDLESRLVEERGRRESERADLEAHTARLREQADVLAGELADAVARHDEARARARRLEAELDGREAAESRFREERTALIGDLDRAHELARQQAEQNAALRDRNREMEAALEAARRDEEEGRRGGEVLIADLRRELEEYRVAWRQTIDQSERDACGLREQADALRAERDSALDRARALERRCEALAARLERAEHDRTAAEGSLRGEVERIERLEAALACASRDRDEALGLARDLAHQAAELQAELDRLAGADASCRRGDGPSPGRDLLPVPVPRGREVHDAGGSRPSPTRVERAGGVPHPRPGPDDEGDRSPDALPLHREVRWHMEMNRRIAELQRRRRR